MSALNDSPPRARAGMRLRHPEDWKDDGPSLEKYLRSDLSVDFDCFIYAQCCQENLICFGKKTPGFEPGAFVKEIPAFAGMTSCDYWYFRFAQVQNARLCHAQASLGATLALRIFQELHVRQLSSEFLHLIGVGHEGGTGVPGTVEELTAGAVGERKLDGFVTHLERTAFSARDKFCTRVGFDPGKDLVGRSVVYLVAGHANSHTVTEEDFGVAFGDDGADAPALQSLRSVFTAGAATEVLVRNEDGAVLVGRITERVNLALSGETGDIVGKGVVAEAFEGHALEEASRDDTVSVDIVSANRNAGTFNNVDRIHFLNLLALLDVLADVGDTAFDGGGSHHGGAHQNGAARRAALAALEVTVAGRSAHLAVLELIRVHGEAERAACFAPFGTGFLEDLVETELFGFHLDLHGARHHPHLDGRGDLVALDDFGGGLQVAEAAVGAATHECDVDRAANHLGTFFPAHVFISFGNNLLFAAFEFVDLRHVAVERDGLSRRDAPGHHRFEFVAVDFDFVVKLGVGVGSHGLPVSNGFVPLVSLRGVRTALEVFKSLFVGVAVTDAGATFDSHVADGHTAFHAHVFDDGACKFVSVANTTVHAELSDVSKGDVLGGHTRLELAGEVDTASLERAHGERLGGENVGHLAGTDTEGDSAEGTVCCRMGVAASNGHTRLGHTFFRAHDVDNALFCRRGAKELDAVRLGVVFDMGEHLFGNAVLERTVAFREGGRNNMVDRGESAFREQHLLAFFAELGEGLRTRHFVAEVKPDKELALAARQLSYRVAFENFLIE